MHACLHQNGFSYEHILANYISLTLFKILEIITVFTWLNAAAAIGL